MCGDVFGKGRLDGEGENATGQESFAAGAKRAENVAVMAFGYIGMFGVVFVRVYRMRSRIDASIGRQFSANVERDGRGVRIHHLRFDVLFSKFIRLVVNYDFDT